MSIPHDHFGVEKAFEKEFWWTLVKFVYSDSTCMHIYISCWFWCWKKCSEHLKGGVCQSMKCLVGAIKYYLCVLHIPKCWCHNDKVPVYVLSVSFLHCNTQYCTCWGCRLHGWGFTIKHLFHGGKFHTHAPSACTSFHCKRNHNLTLVLIWMEPMNLCPSIKIHWENIHISYTGVECPPSALDP